MSSTVIAKNVQIGADGTASNNFTIFQPATPDGTLRIGNGNTGITSSAVALTSAGNLGIGTSSPGTKLHVDGGSVSTYIRVSNTGSTNGLYVGLDSAGESLLSAVDAKPLKFATSNTERMRIDSSGNVGIGTSSPAARLDVRSGATTFGAQVSTTGTNTYTPTAATSLAAANLQITGGNASGACTGIRLTQSSNFELFFGGVQEAGGAGAFVFQGYSGAAYGERMRIDSSGNLLVGTTNNGGYKSIIQADAGSGYVLQSNNGTNAAGNYNFRVYQNNNSDSGYFLVCDRPSGSRLGILNSGNVQNTNNSYGALSDIKLKENITDATPKLEKLQQVRVVNYNLIGEEQKQIGVIAQELEQIFPSMVEEHEDYDAVTTVDEDGNEKTERVSTGTTTKSVKYSVFVPMLIKAIQEQQAIITALTARVTALEGTQP